jgi:hypothetical protein
VSPVEHAPDSSAERTDIEAASGSLSSESDQEGDWHLSDASASARGPQPRYSGRAVRTDFQGNEPVSVAKRQRTEQLRVSRLDAPRNPGLRPTGKPSRRPASDRQTPER